MSGKVCVMKRAGGNKKTFESFYEEFILSRRVQNVRPATIEFYFWHLKPLKEYMIEKKIESINEICKRDLDQFILWLSARQSNPITINTYLRATRAFIYYAMSLDYLEAFSIKLVKHEKPVKETYSDEDISKLVKRPNLKQCRFTQYRDWVMVQYFLETGNRLNTVINIKVQDINLEAGLAILRTTKNRKPMYSPMGSSLVKILAEYIREWSLKDDDYLFPNPERKQLTKNAIQNTIAKYNKSRGVDLSSIHCFRHTFAKKYIMKGGNAFKLQKLLGHSCLTVTEQYISLFANDLAKDFDKFSTIDEFNGSSRMQRKN